VYLSIVTVCFNDLVGLKRTIKSVLPLPNNTEWIVIDGGSSDGTLEYLQSITENNFQFVSEVDKGIFDAMNKGILRAKGEYLSFMNSGDLYIREIFLEVVSEGIKTHDVLTYDYHCLNNRLVPVNSNKLSVSEEDLKFKSSIPHQSSLIRRSVFLEIGLYNQMFSHGGDYELFARMLSKNCFTFKFSPNRYLAYFVLDGLTSKNRSCYEQGKQHRDIQLLHFGSASKKRFLMFNLRYLLSFIPYSDHVVEKIRRVFFGIRA